MALLNQKLIKSIFENNFYGFKEIKSIERLITVEYTQENLITISEVLKTGAYSRIDKLEPSRNVFGENLVIFKFSDQDSKLFYGLYVDFETDLKVYDIFLEQKERSS
jgi:hypothetical protein